MVDAATYSVVTLRVARIPAAQQNHSTQELTPRAHHGKTTGSGESNSGRLVKHARYYWLFLAESHLTRRLFGAMLQRIWALPVPAG